MTVKLTRGEAKLFVEVRRSELRRGLTRRQRIFILEKLAGLRDKDAALAADYSLSVAENTKQRIWKKRCHLYRRWHQG